jgi:hypothetical protein
MFLFTKPDKSRIQSFIESQSALDVTYSGLADRASGLVEAADPHGGRALFLDFQCAVYSAETLKVIPSPSASSLPNAAGSSPLSLSPQNMGGRHHNPSVRRRGWWRSPTFLQRDAV